MTRPRPNLTCVSPASRFQRFSPEELVTRLAAIVDSSEDAIIGRDEHGTINTWNAAAQNLFGFNPSDVIGQSELLLVPPELHAQELANLERLRTGERIAHYQTQRLRKGGERVPLSFALSPIYDSDGQFIGSAAIARPVDRTQREEAARARLAAIVDSTDDAIVAKDLNSVITDWNAAAERLFGYTAEEIVGRSIVTIIPPELQHEEPVLLGKIKTGERIQHYETQRLHKSGRRIDVSLTLSPIRDSFGRVIGASKIARDVSDRRRTEMSRLMLAAIVESSDDAIVSKNLDGIITSWNAAAERLFGYTPDEIIGQSVLRLIPRELYFEEPRIIAKLRSGERIDHFETRRMRKNGELLDVSLTVSPIKDSTGRVIGASKIVRDISQRKAAEAALIEREKLAATGRLAATLAHEVNNPLEAIANLSYLLSNDDSLSDRARELANLLQREVQRAGDITRQTLSYYRDSRLTGTVNVVDTIEHVLAWKRKRIDAKRINVRTDFVSACVIRGYAGELRQVFDNLIDNAIDAVPESGNIHVRTRVRRRSGTDRLVISVGDNGSGIPRPVRNKIFDPFFTTKMKTGTGLGLWVTRSVVEKHGGTIRVRSSENPRRKGTVFCIELPVDMADCQEQVSAQVSVG